MIFTLQFTSRDVGNKFSSRHGQKGVFLLSDLLKFVKNGNSRIPTLTPFVGDPKSFEDWPEYKLYYEDFRPALHAMWQSITELNFWEQMKNDPPKREGFMYCSLDYVEKIKRHPLNVEQGHSGASEGFCLRMMQFIGRKGWNVFVENVRKGEI